MRYVEAMDGRLSALYSIRKYVGQILLYDGSPGGQAAREWTYPIRPC